MTSSTWNTAHSSACHVVNCSCVALKQSVFALSPQCRVGAKPGNRFIKGRHNQGRSVPSAVLGCVLARHGNGEDCCAQGFLYLSGMADRRYGMIEAISHLIHRDYEAIVQDFITLRFIPKGEAADHPFLSLCGGGGALLACASTYCVVFRSHWSSAAQALISGPSFPFWPRCLIRLSREVRPALLPHVATRFDPITWPPMLFKQ